ncbi:MAG: tetratricopeptide repeat protein [Bradyrhizobiaceae bacterium]|nr:tetratricopeptide repeat protein [Bradyrhizobiaceae bacterium]
MVTLYQAGRYSDAAEIAKRALALAESQFDPDHPTVGTRLSRLAALYFLQGRYAEAEPLLKRALAIDEKAFSADDLAVDTDLSNLAGLYRPGPLRRGRTTREARARNR